MLEIRPKILSHTHLAGAGYSQFKTYSDVSQFWVGFLKEIPKHGSPFALKNPTYGSNFQNFPGLA